MPTGIFHAVPTTLGPAPVQHQYRRTCVQTRLALLIIIKTAHDIDFNYRFIAKVNYNIPQMG